MKNLKHYKKNINYNKSFIYSKKNYLRYSLTIENNIMNKKHQFPSMSNSSSYGNDLFGAFRSSTMKDYYKLYIGDEPQHRSVKIPKDYSYEDFKKEMSVRHTNKEMAENPVLDRIEQILTFEEHRIIFCELD